MGVCLSSLCGQLDLSPFGMQLSVLVFLFVFPSCQSFSSFRSVYLSVFPFLVLPFPLSFALFSFPLFIPLFFSIPFSSLSSLSSFVSFNKGKNFWTSGLASTPLRFPLFSSSTISLSLLSCFSFVLLLLLLLCRSVGQPEDKESERKETASIFVLSSCLSWLGCCSLYKRHLKRVFCYSSQLRIRERGEEGGKVEVNERVEMAERTSRGRRE